MLLQSLTLAVMLVAALGQEAVDLGTAADYVILAKSGISTTGVTAVLGDIAVSPIGAAALTGFSWTLDSTTEFATAGVVTGKLLASDFTTPTPSKLTTAISDMETAYTAAAGQSVVVAANQNVKAGLIGGTTFTAGVYNWGTTVSIATDIVIQGTATDLFVFQTSGSVMVSPGAKITLDGGALASNIVWQVAGFVDAGTTSHLEGIFLVATHAAFKTGSSINGRVFAQTAATLDATTVNPPV